LQAFANQTGNIGAIVSAVATAVFFTMLLVTANAMAQSVRERIGEIAVMRTLGFSSAAVTLLVLIEGLAITLFGSAVGMWLGDGLSSGIASAMQQFLPLMLIPPRAFATGALIALVLGFLSCALPCAQVARLQITEQLRRA
jgi:putative ABC transport system permease protein